MSSKLRSITNAENAQHSTGPNTPEGKRVSSQNSRKLGLFVADSTLLEEEPGEFAQILAGYIAEYTPDTPIENHLVRQLALATLKQERYSRIETGILSKPPCF